MQLRPVIASIIVGMPELENPGVNGWMTRPGAINELTEAMTYVRETLADQLNKMAANGQNIVVSDYLAIKNLEKLGELFRKS